MLGRGVLHPRILDKSDSMLESLENREKFSSLGLQTLWLSSTSLLPFRRRLSTVQKFRHTSFIHPLLPPSTVRTKRRILGHVFSKPKSKPEHRPVSTFSHTEKRRLQLHCFRVRQYFYNYYMCYAATIIRLQKPPQLWMAL
jgi:hypothetical protein